MERVGDDYFSSYYAQDVAEQQSLYNYEEQRLAQAPPRYTLTLDDFADAEAERLVADMGSLHRQEGHDEASHRPYASTSSHGASWSSDSTVNSDVPDLEHSHAPEGWRDEYESSHGSDSESEHEHSDFEERIPTPSLSRSFEQPPVDVVRADSSTGSARAETVEHLPLANLKLSDKPKKQENHFRRILGLAKKPKKTKQNGTSDAHSSPLVKSGKT